MLCPRCRTGLNRTIGANGLFFRCPKCDGRAVAMSVLRRVGSNRAIRDLWQRARNGNGDGTADGAECPSCGRAMVEMPTPRVILPPKIDVCPRCEFIWFDPKEFERFPPNNDVKPPLPEKAREAIAMQNLRLDAWKQEQASYRSSDPPDETWQWIPAMFGLPVEENAPAITRWPWMTYGLAAVLVAVFAMTVGNLKPVIDEYGLVPAQFGRHGGLTLLTCFFLHAGLWHLIGNIYFLIIFGDNVEDDLGRWQFAALLIAATLFGDFVHILADPHSPIPCIGASGGISAVVTYYALRFPRARLGFLLRFWYYFRWVHLPAYGFLILWFILQIALFAHQQLGAGGVAATAHLGGAFVGAAAWLLWRTYTGGQKSLSVL